MKRNEMNEESASRFAQLKQQHFREQDHHHRGCALEFHTFIVTNVPIFLEFFLRYGIQAHFPDTHETEHGHVVSDTHDRLKKTSSNTSKKTNKNTTQSFETKSSNQTTKQTTAKQQPKNDKTTHHITTHDMLLYHIPPGHTTRPLLT